MLAIHNDIEVKNEEVIDIGAKAKKIRNLVIYLIFFIVFGNIEIKKMA